MGNLREEYAVGVSMANRRAVLSGPSLYAYRPVVAGLVVTMGIGFITLLILFARAGSHPSKSIWSVVTASIVVVIGLAFLSAVPVILATARSRAELAAGYTTTPFGYPEVDLVDPRTGTILRNAGEPLIDKKTFLMRRSDARLAAKTMSPSSRTER